MGAACCRGLTHAGRAPVLVARKRCPARKTPEARSLEARLRAAPADGIMPYVAVPDHDLGIVIKVYDGDSWTLLCEIAQKPAKLSLRLRGIDTPELHGGKGGERESQAGQVVRDHCTCVFLGSVLLLRDYGKDKYGRTLCDASAQDAAGRAICPSIAEYLTQRALAVPYGGGTKQAFTAAFLDDILARQKALRDAASSARPGPALRPSHGNAAWKPVAS